MTDQKPVFNPQAAPKKKKQQKKSRFSFTWLDRFKRVKQLEPNTRMISFAPKTAHSVFSYLFFGLFLVMCLVVLMTFGRVDTLSRLAMSKQVNKEELVTNINNGLQSTEQLKYEGTKLADRLFTFSHKEDGKKYWEDQMQTYLATGLNVNDLGLNTSEADRIARTVRYIKMDTVNEKSSIYRLYYDVRFTEGNKWHQVQVILPCSFAQNELKLVDYPMVTNLATAESENDVSYQENRFTPKGKKATEEQRKEVTEFVNRFFDLYVRNDEKLALVTKAKGIGGARLQNVEVKRIIQTESNHYYVQGNYQFYYEESNPLSSQFILDIKQTKDSYFVTKINGV